MSRKLRIDAGRVRIRQGDNPAVSAHLAVFGEPVL
jgi:hypothetical protein